MVKYDEWRETLNAPETYATIAADLIKTGPVVIGWTDQHCTHFDVLFTLAPIQYGTLQGGLRGPTDLFVSIMRIGAFAFDVLGDRGDGDLHPGYIAEKLLRHSGAENPTTTALTDLINGVIRALRLAPQATSGK